MKFDFSVDCFSLFRKLLFFCLFFLSSRFKFLWNLFWLWFWFFMNFCWLYWFWSSSFSWFCRLIVFLLIFFILYLFFRRLGSITCWFSSLRFSSTFAMLRFWLFISFVFFWNITFRNWCILFSGFHWILFIFRNWFFFTFWFYWKIFRCFSFFISNFGFGSTSGIFSNRFWLLSGFPFAWKHFAFI